MIQKEPGKSIETQAFKENQVVRAKVLDVLSQGKAQLLINGEKMMVSTGLRLTPGEELMLKAVHQKGVVLLKLMEPLQPPLQPIGTKQLPFLTQLLSNPQGLSDIVRTKIPGLRNLLQDLALKSGRRDDSFLPRLIENNGMMLEKKLASLLKSQDQSKGQDQVQDRVKSGLDQLLKQDVKGVLLNLLSLEMSKGKTLQKAEAGFLDTLEKFQLVNTQTSESGRFLIPFPIFDASYLSFGQLFLDMGGKKETRSQDKIVWISFLLNMTQIGSVRADFSILKKAITGRFLLENEDIREYVKSMIPELKSGLERLDYTVGAIDCAVAAPDEIAPNALIESLFKNQEAGVLDIVV